MNVMERALAVKYNLFRRFGANKICISKEDIIRAICASGLAKKSRYKKSVFAYLRDHRHLGERDGLYYVIYRRKENANPRGVLFQVSW